MKIREVARGLQFPEGPIAMDDGSVLLVEIARGTLSRVTPDGRIHVVADLGGGPNGAAIGPDGAVYVCNNGGFRWGTEIDGTFRPIGQAENYSGGRIERVDLNTGRFDRLYDTVDGLGLRGPNDIVFDAHGGFYFTDLGKVRETEIDRGGVFYGRPDGSAAHAIARPVMTPNGIGLSPDGQTLYYAETEGARVWAYDIAAPGQVRKLPWPSLNGARMVTASPGGHWQRFDSMAIDAFGNLCVATLLHGGISIVSPDGGATHHVPLPDRFTTNLCFGGRDRRTAFVTLSGSGRLVAIDDWPVPGLKLNYEA
ncbi:MAG TPA: SMP-30/gluconolactonase/LRE family protein [Burkholderiaceae bacterium]|nr:SMP-30/gluconolactonase/LRE family protein [Burkholderiaceae bacterium]